jgi:DNA adenine methylase
MQYFGGKFKIANDIVEILEYNRKEDQIFVEPFVGGANIVSKMSGVRFAFDKHFELIEMYKSLQNGWIPPENINREDREKAIKGLLEPCLTAFIGFGCCYAGVYFAGYAENKRGDNFAKNAKNSLLRKMLTMKNVNFQNKDYRELKFEDALIYCDPPYNGVNKYKIGDFDSFEFWEYMRLWSKNNDVFISEYNAPEDFICIWNKKVKTEIRTKLNGREDRIEKLFIHKNNLKNIRILS